MFSKSPDQRSVQLSAINTKFSWKKVFASAKIQKQSPQVFRKKRPATLLKRESSRTRFLRATISHSSSIIHISRRCKIITLHARYIVTVFDFIFIFILFFPACITCHFRHSLHIFQGSFQQFIIHYLLFTIVHYFVHTHIDTHTQTHTHTKWH